MLKYLSPSAVGSARPIGNGAVLARRSTDEIASAEIGNAWLVRLGLGLVVRAVFAGSNLVMDMDWVVCVSMACALAE